MGESEGGKEEQWVGETGDKGIRSYAVGIPRHQDPIAVTDKQISSGS